MADLPTRVLVRLTDAFWLSVDDVNRALSHSRGPRKPGSPGPEATLEALQVLERRGLAEEQDGKWRQTRAGAAEDTRLEDAFDNSGGYGNYGL